MTGLQNVEEKKSSVVIFVFANKLINVFWCCHFFYFVDNDVLGDTKAFMVTNSPLKVVCYIIMINTLSFRHQEILLIGYAYCHLFFGHVAILVYPTRDISRCLGNNIVLINKYY